MFAGAGLPPAVRIADGELNFDNKTGFT